MGVSAHPGGSDGFTPRHRDLIETLRKSVVETPGAIDPSLRRAVEARAASRSGRRAPVEDVPAELTRFVDTVARGAYRITIEDVEGLRRSGHSEDAIFEVLASAALGSASGRLERAMAALKGEV